MLCKFSIEKCAGHHSASHSQETDARVFDLHETRIFIGLGETLNEMK